MQVRNLGRQALFVGMAVVLAAIRARLHFYPRLGATPFDYLYILKSIIAGILPNGAVKLYRQLFVMSSK